LPNQHNQHSLQRKSETISGLKRKSEFSKTRHLLKALKPGERVQTQPNEVLHVNNLITLNFGSFSPLNCTVTQLSMN
jgi:hypothetical protein